MSRNILYNHFVFTPKSRRAVICPETEKTLFAYIVGISNHLRCPIVRINAALNHLHLLVRMAPSVSPSEYMAMIKRASSIFIKRNNLFPGFDGWSKEYSVHSVSPAAVNTVRDYIANQKEHHKLVSFEDEWLSSLPPEEREMWKMTFFDR